MTHPPPRGVHKMPPSGRHFARSQEAPLRARRDEEVPPAILDRELAGSASHADPWPVAGTVSRSFRMQSAP